jgi:hypothetical protein
MGVIAAPALLILPAAARTGTDAVLTHVAPKLLKKQLQLQNEELDRCRTVSRLRTEPSLEVSRKQIRAPAHVPTDCSSR